MKSTGMKNILYVAAFATAAGMAQGAEEVGVEREEGKESSQVVEPAKKGKSLFGSFRRGFDKKVETLRSKITSGGNTADKQVDTAEAAFGAVRSGIEQAHLGMTGLFRNLLGGLDTTSSCANKAALALKLSALETKRSMFDNLVANFSKQAKEVKEEIAKTEEEIKEIKGCEAPVVADEKEVKGDGKEPERVSSHKNLAEAAVAVVHEKKEKGAE